MGVVTTLYTFLINVVVEDLVVDIISASDTQIFHRCRVNFYHFPILLVDRTEFSIQRKFPEFRFFNYKVPSKYTKSSSSASLTKA